MNADDYMRAVKERNPKVFAAAAIKITPKSLEKHLRHAFYAGRLSSEDNGLSLQSILEAIFGKAK